MFEPLPAPPPPPKTNKMASWRISPCLIVEMHLDLFMVGFPASHSFVFWGVRSLKLTYPLKMDGWKTSFLRNSGMAYFQLQTVSFREGSFFWLAISKLVVLINQLIIIYQ